jgi:hypothetical protein
VEVPFYAETSVFQLWTAIAYLIAASLLFSTERKRFEYFGAGIVCTYIAFDEHFMFHECIRLYYPHSKNVIHGDLTIFVLCAMGITASLWGIFKLSRTRLEMILYAFASFLCCLQIYLDVYEKKLFYLLLDTEIEEISEFVLAFTLILIAIFAKTKRRFFIIAPILILIFFCLENNIHHFIWNACPRLKVFQ